MGVRAAAGDRRAPDRGRAARPTSPRRSSSAARCPASGRSCAPLAEIAERGRRRHRAARGDDRRAPSRACASASRGSSGARCTAGGSPSRARRAQASGLAATLRGAGRRGRRGAGDPDRAARRSRSARRAIGDYDLVCLTSPNGAELFFDALAERGRTPVRSPARTVAAIGPGTAAALAAAASGPTSCPSAGSPRRWSTSWPAAASTGKRVLVARAAEARDVLPTALRERGAEVDVVPLYETVARAARRAGSRGAGAKPTT